MLDETADIKSFLQLMNRLSFVAAVSGTALECHSLPFSPAYSCMPWKWRKVFFCPFPSQFLIIAGAPRLPLGTRNAHLKNCPDVRRGCQPNFLMQQLILWVFLRRHSPAPPSAGAQQPANYPALFLHLPDAALRASAILLQAKEQSKLIPSSSILEKSFKLFSFEKSLRLW